MGASCTFALLIILLIYAGYKVSVLEGRKKVDILQAVNKNSYDVNYIFGGEQGLNVAIAVFDLYDHTDQLMKLTVKKTFQSKLAKPMTKEICNSKP